MSVTPVTDCAAHCDRSSICLIRLSGGVSRPGYRLGDSSGLFDGPLSSKPLGRNGKSITRKFCCLVSPGGRRDNYQRTAQSLSYTIFLLSARASSPSEFEHLEWANHDRDHFVSLFRRPLRLGRRHRWSVLDFVCGAFGDLSLFAFFSLCPLLFLSL